MDPFEALDSIDEDTSCCLIAECLRRGHRVYYFQVKDLELQKSQTWGRVSRITKKTAHRFEMTGPRMMRLDELQVIFMRKDPPFDLDYLYSTYILEYVPPTTLVINSPQGIRNANEKLYVLNFPRLAPRSLVSKKPEELKKFLLKIGGQMVTKPLNNCSGKGVLYLRKDDINLNSLLELTTEKEKNLSWLKSSYLRCGRAIRGFYSWRENLWERCAEFPRLMITGQIFIGVPSSPGQRFAPEMKKSVATYLLTY